MSSRPRHGSGETSTSESLEELKLIKLGEIGASVPISLWTCELPLLYVLTGVQSQKFVISETLCLYMCST